MRITLSGAMRARDVSRPTDEQLDAAAEREARITRVGRPSGGDAAVGPARAAAVAAVVAAPNRPGAPSAAAARTARPASLRDAEGASASVRDPEGSSAAVRDAAGSPAAVRDGKGTGRNGAGAGERASDEVSPTRRRRRRRGR